MASWTGTYYKTSSTKRHHVDRADDEILPNLAYGWMVNYNQRGLAVRMVCSPDAIDQIGHVKFLTREEKIDKTPHFSWKCKHDYSFESFKDHVNSDLKEFEWPELSGKPWDEINAFIEKMQFRYEEINGIAQWKGTWPSDFKLSAEHHEAVETYIAAFCGAMYTDFENGEAKDWITELVQMLMKSDDLSDWTVKCKEPPLHCKTNVYLETIFGDIENETTMDKLNASFKCPTVNSCSDLSLDMLSITSSENHSEIKSGFVVPDVFVALPEYPGVFPLIVEMKQGRYRHEGEFQNIKQMLTKMFYQDVIFGLAITPKGYIMSYIRKEDALYYVGTNFQHFTPQKKGEDHKLEISSLKNLYSFIYGILKWSRKTKCKLPTVSVNDSVS